MVFDHLLKDQDMGMCTSACVCVCMCVWVYMQKGIGNAIKMPVTLEGPLGDGGESKPGTLFLKMQF